MLTAVICVACATILYALASTRLTGLRVPPRSRLLLPMHYADQHRPARNKSAINGSIQRQGIAIQPKARLSSISTQDIVHVPLAVQPRPETKLFGPIEQPEESIPVVTVKPDPEPKLFGPIEQRQESIPAVAVEASPAPKLFGPSEQPQESVPAVAVEPEPPSQEIAAYTAAEAKSIADGQPSLEQPVAAKAIATGQPTLEQPAEADATAESIPSTSRCADNYPLHRQYHSSGPTSPWAMDLHNQAVQPAARCVQPIANSLNRLPTSDPNACLTGFLTLGESSLDQVW